MTLSPHPAAASAGQPAAGIPPLARAVAASRSGHKRESGPMAE
jgi:hypothetical protein